MKRLRCLTRNVSRALTPNWVSSGIVHETIESRYRRIGTFTHGFDYLRIILAAAVVFQHSIVSSYGGAIAGDVWSSWARIFFAPILPMFFGLSGFLVTGSLKKNPTLTSFMTLRAVRIVPALSVEVLLSALLLGPILTNKNLADYFTDHAFFAYFLNIIGRVRYELPGVFTDVPYPNIVNLSLWTIPYELECYVILMLLYAVGVVRHRRLLPVVVTLAIILGTSAAAWQWDAYAAADRPIPRSLVVAFLVGVCLNLYADRIQLSVPMAGTALVLMVATTLDYRTIYLAAVPAVYLCVYFGMMHPPKKGPLFSGDYSYGLYLFAFPIQQTFSYLFVGHRHWQYNFMFALTFGLLYAMFSWWCVESRILARKSEIVRAAENLRDAMRALVGLSKRGHVTGKAERI